jgi:hypothetical protein
METKNEIMILPIEVKELAEKVSAEKQIEVQNILNQIFAGTADWEKKASEIKVNDINDVMTMEMANAGRKNVKAARLIGEKLIDGKRSEVQARMIDDKLEDALWLKSKQIMQLKFKAIEEKFEHEANFKQRYEAEQKELRTIARLEKILKFRPDVMAGEFVEMSDETFNMFLSGAEKVYNDKVEAEAKIEAERLAKIEADKKERERIQAENEKLKKEREEKERELEAERKKAAEAKRLSDAEALKQKQIADLKLKKEREEKEKIEKKLQAKKDAEALALKQAKEKAAKDIAEQKRLAKAPDKEKLNKWVDDIFISFTPADLGTDAHIMACSIQKKFSGFKEWAKFQIETL